MAEEQRTRVVIETSFEGKGLVDARVAVDKLADSQKKQTKASKEAATGLKDEATAADGLSQSTVGAKKAADALTDASKKQNKALVETTSVVESTATAVDRLGEKTDATAVKQRRASKVTASTAKGTKASGLAFQDAAELAERMRAALGPLGDVLGDVTGGADDVGTALKGFTGTQVAVAAGTVALVAGMVKFGGAVLDVLVNLDQYEDQVARLRGQGIIDDADGQHRHQGAVVAVQRPVHPGGDQGCARRGELCTGHRRRSRVRSGRMGGHGQRRSRLPGGVAGC
jgi:hypothetical protein